MAENESRIVMVAKFPEFPEEGFPPGLPQILGVGLEYGAVEGGSPKEHVIFQIEVTAPHADVLPEWYQDLNAAPQTPPDPIEFTVVPQNNGFRFLDVNFYYNNRWMRRISFGKPPVEEPS